MVIQSNMKQFENSVRYMGCSMWFPLDTLQTPTRDSTLSHVRRNYDTDFDYDLYNSLSNLSKEL